MNIVTARVLSEGASLKRSAWAYGCAKKGSEDERLLLELLLERVAQHVALIAAGAAEPPEEASKELK